MAESPNLRAEQQAFVNALPRPIIVSARPEVQEKFVRAFKSSFSRETAAIQAQFEPMIERLGESLETDVAELLNFVSAGEGRVKEQLDAIGNIQREADKLLADVQRATEERRNAIESASIKPKSTRKLKILNAELRSDGYIYLYIKSKRLYDIDHVHVRLETNSETIPPRELQCWHDGSWSTRVPAMKKVDACISGEGVRLGLKYQYRIALLVNNKFVAEEILVKFSLP